MRTISTLESNVLIATVDDADEQLAAEVIAAPLDDDGRSRWMWVRLANGDLMLGLFPHGGTYDRISQRIRV